jgi:hypothetical protein
MDSMVPPMKMSRKIEQYIVLGHAKPAASASRFCSIVEEIEKSEKTRQANESS